MLLLKPVYPCHHGLGITIQYTAISTTNIILLLHTKLNKTKQKTQCDMLITEQHV